LSRWIPVAPSLTAPGATLERTEGSVSWGDREPPVIGGGLRAGTILETGTDGRVAVRLRAGASVRVDIGTSLRIVSAETLLLNRGGVYVDTEGPSEAGASVTIRTPLGLVRDVGTQFQVRATAGAVLVSVREGIARFERNGSAHEAPSGIQISVQQDGSVTRQPVPSSGPEWDWVLSVAPDFELEGSLLGEYLDWVGRETGLRVEYGAPSISSDAMIVVLHGSIEGLRPDETLGAVLSTCSLSHRIRDDSLIVERVVPEAAP
jgi:hypothetical protein